MPCPHHNSGEKDATSDSRSSDEESRGIDRRELMKSALAIGGTSALSTVVSMYGMPDAAAAAPDDPVTVADRSNRQHAWDAFETAARGTTVPPPHHLLLFVDYAEDGTPSPNHRREASEAFREIERHFDWSHEGILFTVGYSPEYFDRFDEDLPEGLAPERGEGLLRAEPTIEEIALDHEDPAADTNDAVVHMASDHVQNLLAAEAALWGENVDTGGGDVDPEFAATLDGIFTRPESYPERRVGFTGYENLTESLANDTDYDPGDLSEKSDVSMGFNPLYENSVPRETNATIVEDQKLEEPKPPGMFAQGSIQHVSKLDIDLQGWYDDHDLPGRRERVFSPHHTADDVGTAGENLGDSNAPSEAPTRNPDYDGEDVAERVEADATEGRPVGHTQKVARARFDLERRLTDDAEGDPARERDDDLRGHESDQELETVLLRRDFNTTDQGTPGMHFVALMRFNGYMIYTRQAMNGVEFDTEAIGLEGDGRIRHDDVDVVDEDNGIVSYLTTQRRGNFLVPPITLRALPPARAHDADVSATRNGDTFVVEITDVEHDCDKACDGPGTLLDLDTIRFGYYRDVNRGGGTGPTDVSDDGDTLVLEFPADATGLNRDQRTVRLFAKIEETRRPVIGTTRFD